MSPDMLVVVLGGAVNLVILLGVAWKGGLLLGGFQRSIEGWAEETRNLRKAADELRCTVNEHTEALARAMAILENLERRVARLENGAER